MNNRIKFYKKDVGEGDYFVDELFERIGYKVVSKTERGQGWQRCFIHDVKDRDIPLSVARLTFFEGCLYYVHTYPKMNIGESGPIKMWCIPWMKITWLLYTGKALDDAHINKLMATANFRANENFQFKLKEREELNKRKPKKRRALARPNPIGWLRKVMAEEIKKHLEARV